ncbi:Bug family tripartite tricarboxylate transporter substrate binding protein [Advenella mimigardefordensis]|uniref:Putative Bug-like extracytoplasmic solute binding receptor, TTT family n=1 Tax=Advenella mimigardefordensis (strain DSM 17166 / LMG 22922 / DPN7) TaxID=1247726 RepID=W0PBT8_ADVMD|nr:tripartite tricarboxylate transporter substrate binding protein [Advenella mimigardefordensis]AHG62885.1 putative Bug-like extracytoplasmic solute binding receptor, TTT family [Advenella mimigardefordensis DPN7]
MSKIQFAIATATLAAASVPGFACAQDAWPNKAITYVVPFPAGSNTDVLGRIIADELSKRLKVPVVIENKPGATGMIGSTSVARAKADGYTIMGGSIASHAINAGLFPNMQYDPAGDFTPITIIGFNANTLVVSNNSPFSDVKAIIAAAKDKPDSISYASSGIGTTQHLSGVLFGQQANIRLVHIPYGGKAALPDVMGGQVDMMFEGPTVIPHVQQKTVRALAVTSKTRLASLPDVPTMQELGLPEYEMRSWQAIFAPKGTPEPIVEKLYSNIKAILDQPHIQQKLDTMGVEPSGMPPAEFAAFQKEEIEKWRAVIKRANIKVQ